MRAGVYGRISDDRLGDEHGVKQQIADGRALVGRRGGEIVLEKVDNDISALTGKRRPGYEAIMAAADQSLITHIVVFHTSRLWRNRRERAEGIERLRKAGVSVVAVRGPELDMTTAYGRGMAGMIGEFDTMESEVKSERVRRRVEELAAEGKISNGGSRPYGYHRVFAGDGKHRRILRDEIEPTEAEVIRDLAYRLLAGESKQSIIRDLNDRGVPTSTGKTWTAQSLITLMRGGRLAGLREHHGVIVGPAVWPAIIDRETHERLRALLDARHPPTGRLARLHYLSGFVYCSACTQRDVRMRVQALHKKAGDGRLRYCCPSKAEGGCNGRAIGLVDLEDMVERYMVRRLSDRQTLRELAAREAVRTDATAELLAQIEADERRLDLLKVALDDGEEDELPEVVATVRAVRRRIQVAREELSHLVDLPAVGGDALPDLARRWKELPLPRKQALLRLFVARILIAPARRGVNQFDPGRVDIVPVGLVIQRGASGSVRRELRAVRPRPGG